MIKRAAAAIPPSIHYCWLLRALLIAAHAFCRLVLIAVIIILSITIDCGVYPGGPDGHRPPVRRAFKFDNPTNLSNNFYQII